MTDDSAQELEYREDILLRIMDLVTEMGVEFAFPTRTLHVESLPLAKAPGAQEKAPGAREKVPILTA
jgi:small-conductance mechanosensitive channel